MRVLILLLAMALSGNLFAQVNAMPAGRQDYYNRMEHVFGLIDKNKVNTGLSERLDKFTYKLDKKRKIKIGRAHV